MLPVLEITAELACVADETKARYSPSARERNHGATRSTRPITVHERTAICKSQLEPIIENRGNTRGAEQAFCRWFADGLYRAIRGFSFVCNVGYCRVSSLLHQKPFILSTSSTLSPEHDAIFEFTARQWRHYSSSSGYSAPDSRIAGMKIQVFWNENSSQTNAYSHYCNYYYSGLIPNERALNFYTIYKKYWRVTCPCEKKICLRLQSWIKAVEKL